MQATLSWVLASSVGEDCHLSPRHVVCVWSWLPSPVDQNSFLLVSPARLRKTRPPVRLSASSCDCARPCTRSVGGLGQPATQARPTSRVLWTAVKGVRDPVAGPARLPRVRSISSVLWPGTEAAGDRGKADLLRGVGSCGQGGFEVPGGGSGQLVGDSWKFFCFVLFPSPSR